MSIPERLYRRFGPHVWWSVLITPLVFAPLVAIMLVAITGRYLGITVDDWLAVLAVGFPAITVIGVAGLFVSLKQWRTVLAWKGAGRTPARAPETWEAVLRSRQVLTRAMVICVPFIPLIISWLILKAHEPAWSIAPMLLVGMVGMLSLWSVVVPLSELIMRPMLEDVARHLPGDFDPSDGPKLRAKALAPLPVVALMAALVEGAYASLSHVGAVRLSIALGVGLAAVGVATIIFLLNAQSLISPIDHLISATERVRAGDLGTPVPIVTTDELGQLSHSFNQMLAGLRERETLLEHNAELTEALQASLARIVTAADAERRRVERDLHDGAQQHLVLLNLKLGLMERKVAAADPELAVLARETREDLGRALAELRDLAHGIYPAALENDGLAAALADVAGRAAIPAAVDTDGTGRYMPELEAAVYFCCVEALQNAAKHAGDGARARITLAQADGLLRFEISDNGVGFDAAATAASAGLQNMTDRVSALGGRLRVASSPGQGTTITGQVPATPSSLS